MSTSTGAYKPVMGALTSDVPAADAAATTFVSDPPPNVEAARRKYEAQLGRTPINPSQAASGTAAKKGILPKLKHYGKRLAEGVKNTTRVDPLADITALPGGELGVLASVLGGLLATEGTLYGMGRALERSGRNLPHVSPHRINALLQQVKEEKKVDVGYTHLPDFMEGNAGYITKEEWNKFRTHIKELPDGWLTPKEMRMIQTAINKVDENMRPHGVILTGRHFKKPGTIEHELGHAIATHKGSFLERMSHKPIPRGIGEGLNALTPLVGLGVGVTKGPIVGALAGTAAGLLTNAPTIYGEYAANRYGDQLLRPGEAQHGKNLAFGTYLVGSAMPAAVTGGITGALQLAATRRRW